MENPYSLSIIAKTLNYSGFEPSPPHVELSLSCPIQNFFVNVFVEEILSGVWRRDVVITNDIG